MRVIFNQQLFSGRDNQHNSLVAMEQNKNIKENLQSLLSSGPQHRKYILLLNAQIQQFIYSLVYYFICSFIPLSIYSCREFINIQTLGIQCFCSSEVFSLVKEKDISSHTQECKITNYIKCHEWKEQVSIISCVLDEHRNLSFQDYGSHIKDFGFFPKRNKNLLMGFMQE